MNECPREDVRRELRELLNATEAELGFSPDEEAERVSAAASGRLHTDARALTAVADALAHLRQLEDFTSASTVLPNVLAQRATVTELAKNAKGNTRKTAVGLLSELEQYLGWLSIPMGRWTDSRTHLDRASVLALEADDAFRLSTALSFSAYRHLRRADLSSAEALNEAAARDERVHLGLRTYVTFQRAEVLARVGSKNEALKTLSEAENLVTRLADDDEPLPGSGYWYVSSFFRGQRAFVLHALGDAKEARRVAQEALEAMPPGWQASEWASRRRRLAEA
ncbi:XRE family transcriptional regulator [Amycolatopsis minnesotensis]|uniref:Transcriptional regulator n=1 Tax=Amycolatopsis minnesotensis TaxID=337894 RepID=A0ABN2S853_9PSEU